MLLSIYCRILMSVRNYSSKEVCVYHACTHTCTNRHTNVHCICIYAHYKLLHMFFLPLGDLYIQNVSKSRQKIAKLGNPFITDGTVQSNSRMTNEQIFCVFSQTILTHSISKVVFQLLKAAADVKKRIMVFIAESGKDKSGFVLHTYTL